MACAVADWWGDLPRFSSSRLSAPLPSVSKFLNACSTLSEPKEKNQVTTLRAFVDSNTSVVPAKGMPNKENTTSKALPPSVAGANEPYPIVVTSVNPNMHELKKVQFSS